MVFDQLDQGIYLIIGDRFERDSKIYSPQPVIVSVPSEKKIWKDGESKDRPESVVVQLSTKDVPEGYVED